MHNLEQWGQLGRHRLLYGPRVCRYRIEQVHADVERSGPGQREGHSYVLCRSHVGNVQHCPETRPVVQEIFPVARRQTNVVVR